MDALSVLKSDHDNVKALFKRLRALATGAAAEREELFLRIDEELKIHSDIEENVFYPTFKERSEDEVERDEIAEAYEDHAKVATLLQELESLVPSGASYEEKLHDLMDSVEEHIEDEEGTMFGMARDLFDEGELDRLGAELLAAKEEAKELTGEDLEELEEIDSERRTR